MKHAIHSIIICSLITMSVLAFSCSDSEPHMNQTSKVIINMGLPDDTVSADTSVMDRILRFLSPRPVLAQTAPASFGSINVRITGEDIGIIEKEFSPNESISLNVPAGNQRQLQVTAYVAAGDPSAALSFRGTAIADLPGGETVNVPVKMGLNETKIVAPDNVLTTTFPYQTTKRIVVMNDINGTGFASLTQTEVTALGLSPGLFIPYDISFDARGRMYIANYSTIGIIRIDDINGKNFLQGSSTTPIRFGITGAIASVVTVAVDRNNNWVYFATSSALYRSTLDGLFTQQLTMPSSFTSFNSIRGIDVDDAGMLYIIGSPISAAPVNLIKYDPNNGQQIQIGTGYLTTSSITPSIIDVMVRGQYIYVANINGTANRQFLQLTFSNDAFTLIDGKGTRNTSGTPAGTFFGASRFIAIRSDGFFLIDSNQGGSGVDYDRVLFFNDLAFNGWKTFGSFNTTGNGDAPNAFRFYSSC